MPLIAVIWSAADTRLVVQKLTVYSFRMKSVITHLSALRWLLSHENPREQGDRASRAGLTDARVPPADMLEKLQWFLDQEDRQLEFLVADRSVFRRSKQAMARVHLGALPAGSLIPIPSGNDEISLYVTSPELTFVQCCRRVDLPQAIFYGMALCSGFRIDPYAPGGVTTRRYTDGQLTSVARIGVYLDRLPNIHGSKMARRALPHIKECALSPREIGLAMFFGLPNRLGGMALGHIALNQRVDVYDGRNVNGESRVSARYPDILITATGLEGSRCAAAVDYDADAVHRLPGRPERDTRRRNAIATVDALAHYTITTEDANDFTYLMLTGERIRKQLGVRRWAGIRGHLDSSDNKRKIAELEYRQLELWERFVRNNPLS